MDPVIEFEKKAKGELEKYEKMQKLQEKKKKKEAEFSKQCEEFLESDFYLQNFNPNEWEKRKKEEEGK